MTEAYEAIRARIYELLAEVPEDKITEKYVAGTIRDYTQALLNIEKLKGGETWRE